MVWCVCMLVMRDPCVTLVAHCLCASNTGTTSLIGMKVKKQKEAKAAKEARELFNKCFNVIPQVSIV